MTTRVTLRDYTNLFNNISSILLQYRSCYSLFSSSIHLWHEIKMIIKLKSGIALKVRINKVVPTPLNGSP